jgi:Na+/H+ antiporter
MREAELFVALLIAVVLVALVARRIRRMPHVVALVLGGIVVGLQPFTPDVPLDPEVIFVVFLPPILYPSAFRFAAEDVRGNLRPVAFLALGLVLATMGAIAVAAHLAGLPWAAGFVLGAVLAPTDPVAATAVIRSSGAPDRLATILEGESLINDGTGLTALRIAVATVGTSVSFGGAVGEFVLVALGGAALGAALGWATALIRRRLDDLELESAIAVLLAYGAFILAERLDVSGVLAVVVAGYVMGRAEAIASPDTRIGGASFWSVAQFLAESILFLLVGLAFGQALDDEAARPAGELLGITAAIVATAFAIRMAWMFTVPYLAGLLDPGTRGLAALIGSRERLVLGFAGLRGAVSVAAALSVPRAVDGTPFPERSTVIVVALGAIVVLLVVPALTLPRVLALAGLAGAGDTAQRERRARAALAAAALERADALASRTQLSEDALERVRDRYTERLQRYGDESQEPADADERASDRRALQRETLDAQRQRLSQLRRDGEVSGELLRTLERDLDLEEARIR